MNSDLLNLFLLNSSNSMSFFLLKWSFYLLDNIAELSIVILAELYEFISVNHDSLQSLYDSVSESEITSDSLLFFLNMLCPLSGEGLCLLYWFLPLDVSLHLGLFNCLLYLNYLIISSQQSTSQFLSWCATISWALKLFQLFLLQISQKYWVFQQFFL